MMKWFWVISSVLCSSTAHVFLKKGATSLLLSGSVPAKIWHVMSNLWLTGGAALHGIALVLWVIALSKMPLSVAYPFIALSYVFVSAAAWYFFNEPITPTKLAGMGLVVLGVLLISSNG